MKKYLFMAVAVLASLTACQKDPEQVLVNDGTIKFMSVETRATEVTDIDDFKKTGEETFQVFGYIKGENNVLWESGVYPKWDGTSTWETETAKYWADAKYYNFYAFYPAQTLETKTYEATSFVFDGDGQTDLVAAANCEILGNVFNTAVALNFKHQLSRVAINFVNKFNDPNITIEVLDVVVSDVETGATFTFTAPSSAAQEIVPTLTATTKDNLTFTFDDNKNSIVGAELGQTTTYNAGKSNYMYFLPTSEEKAYNLSCKIKFINNNTNPATTKEVTYPKTGETLTLNANKYLAGDSYVFTANVYDELNPITFTVDVEPWGDDQAVDGDITIGQDKK